MTEYADLRYYDYERIVQLLQYFVEATESMSTKTSTPTNLFMQREAEHMIKRIESYVMKMRGEVQI